MYNSRAHDMLAQYKLEELRKEAALIRIQKRSSRQCKLFNLISLTNIQNLPTRTHMKRVLSKGSSQSKEKL
jgi:hypothetical protein